MSKIILSFRVQEELINLIDFLSSQVDYSRSKFIREAIAVYAEIVRRDYENMFSESQSKPDKLYPFF